MAKTMTWALEDHLCRSCGGRILRSVSGAGMTAGGNPVFKCADCGKATAASGPDALCWCGFAHRRNHHITAYRCLPFSLIESRPELERMFKACGCDPKRGEVGIVLESDLRDAAKGESNGTVRAERSGFDTLPDDYKTGDY